MQNIRKRNGDIVPFVRKKIEDAIHKANLESIDETFDGPILNMLTDDVVAAISSQEIPAVEFIQDTVEQVLIKHNYASTAKAFILYRAEHTKMRQAQGDLMDIYDELTFKKAADADIKRENANIDADTAMGTMLKYGSEGSKYYIDNYILPKDIAAAHADGDIDIHDKDFYMLTETCCQINLLKLFKGGFSTGHGFLREPNDIRSYAALACIAIQANQNEMHGGQAVPNFDYSMAPGVAKTFRKQYFEYLASFMRAVFMMKMEDSRLLAREVRRSIPLELTMSNLDEYRQRLVDFLPHHQASHNFEWISPNQTERAHKFAVESAMDATDRATFQAMEALIHNLNTMNSRAGAQVPFSSINYGTDTSPEARMVMRNLLKATEAGLGNGETPIFPVQIFKVKEGINYDPGDPNYDLFQQACRVSAKRLFPNFSFLDAPYNAQYYKPGKPETEVAYMGCRTRVIANINKDKEIVNGRGNLSFTSVNLPRIAINAKGDVDWFFEELERKVDLVIDQLLERFRVQAARRVRNYPFLMGEGVWLDSEKLGKDDFVGEVLKHGTLTVGFIGLAECLKALTGFHHGENPDSQRLGLEIIGFMRKKMDKATEQYGMNFSLIGTPAEGLSGRFVRIDKQKYGIIPGITDREYYTNSFHVPVYYDISAYDKIRLEAPYHELTNGGHITYIELDGDPLENLDAFEDIVRCMKESGIGYGAINHPVDHDPACGYTGIIGNTCPGCGRDESGEAPFERIRRITGYLVGTLDHFNDAKRAEERDRVKHAVRSEMEMI